MWYRLVLSLALGTSPLVAAPIPLPNKGEKNPQANRLSRGELNLMVRAIQGLADSIVTKYVRSVEQNDLLYAALVGLYKRARLPLPENLAERVGRLSTEEDRTAILEEALLELASAEALTGQNSTLIACQAMVASLDSFTKLILPGAEQRIDDMEAMGKGIGIEIEEYFGVGALRIRLVVPGGPAQRAGVVPTDRITHIDGRAVEKIGQVGIREILAIAPVAEDPTFPLPKPAAMKLTLQRGADRRVVEVRPDRFEVEAVLGVRRRDNHSWDYFIDGECKFAQVRLAKVKHDADEQLEAVIANLKRQGMKGLLLDLRWCPGGYLLESVAIAGLFLREGEIANIRYRESDPSAYRASTTDTKFLDVPIVVLVNAQTSGAGELIAAALQDHNRAVIVGQRTRGKASVQTPTPLIPPIPKAPEGTSFKMTTGMFLRPSGKQLNRFADSKATDDWGVRPLPQHEVRISKNLGDQLKKWWMLQTLRPGGSRRRLPLDDPQADPQRQAAVAVLAALVTSKSSREENPKSEIRNPKQILNSKIKMIKTKRCLCFGFSFSEF